MMLMLLKLHVALLSCTTVVFGYTSDYMTMRQQLFEFDSESQIGHDIHLSEKEKSVDNILLSLKAKELRSSLLSEKSLQEQNFVLVKDEIENSDVFKMIKKMPKGAVLHIHDTSMANYRNLIEKWTYDERCYMCFDEPTKTVHEFVITLKRPVNNRNHCTWLPVQQARANYSSKVEFDAMILSHLTLTEADIQRLKTQNDLWKKFGNIFVLLAGLVSYHEAFEDYYRYSLEQLVEDNVQYAEIRAILPPLYYLNGTTGKGGKETLETYIKVQREFSHSHVTDFYGAKYIYSVLRSLPNDIVQESVLNAIRMYNEFPNHVAGFDLVGQEDAGKSLFHFKDELVFPAKHGKELPYFFHAGETNWQGESVDENLFDAILLNTSRIGHGFAITKHPFLKQEAKRMNISVELCPISNQVLGLVKDLRDHPAIILLSEDQPITVNSDDPGIWGSAPSSHDVYQVLMGMTPANSGLKVLKKLALNSIRYSSLDTRSKEELLKMWSLKWDQFINDVLNDYKLFCREGCQ